MNKMIHVMPIHGVLKHSSKKVSLFYLVVYKILHPLLLPFPERTVDALSGEMQRKVKRLVHTNQIGVRLQTMIIQSKQKHGGVNSLEV